MNHEQGNNQEHKLTKPENLYVEETVENTTEEQTNAAVESEINMSAMKAEQLDQNIAAVGGKEGLQKMWSDMDQAKKDEILKKIKRFSVEKEVASAGQSAAVNFFSPKENWDDAEDTGALRLPITAMMTLLSPMLAAGFGLPPTIDRIKNSVKLNREKKNLKKLEAKYQ